MVVGIERRVKVERGLGDDIVMFGVWLEWRRDGDGLKVFGLSD